MRTSWYVMAIMALFAAFINVPRNMVVPYLVIFCALALWLVEEETRPACRKHVDGGLLDHVRIAKGCSI